MTLNLTLTLNATVPNGNPSLSVTNGGPFEVSLEPDGSWWLRTTEVLDFETISFYDLVLHVSDDGGTTRQRFSSLSASIVATVIVVDRNEVRVGHRQIVASSARASHISFPRAHSLPACPCLLVVHCRRLR